MRRPEYPLAPIRPAHLLRPMGQPTKACPITGRWRRSGPPHSLSLGPLLTRSNPSLWRPRGDGVAAMAAALLRPSPASSAVATYRSRTASSRSIDLSEQFSPLRLLLADRLDLDPLENRLGRLWSSDELSPSPSTWAPPRPTWRGCCSQRLCRRLRAVLLWWCSSA